MKLTRTDAVFSKTTMELFLCRNKSSRTRKNFLENFYGIKEKYWCQEPPEGGPWVSTTHQGAPSRCAQVGYAHLVHLLQVLFAPEIHKYSEKNCIKFSGHSENFYFWVIFYCTGNSENRQNMAFYFI